MTESPDTHTLQASYKRYNLDKDVIDKIERTAKRYGCLHGNKPSVTKLLEKIADGRLSIISSLELVTSHEPLIELDIEVLSDSNGILSLISEKISLLGGNIYFAKADQRRMQSVVKMIFSMQDKSHFVPLLKSIQEITFNDIKKYNNDKQQVKIIKSFSPVEGATFEKMLEFGDFKSTQIPSKNIIFEFITKKMVTNIILTVGLQIVMDNRPGVLGSLSNWISSRYISIRSINVHPNNDGKTSQAELYVGITSDMIDSLDEFDTIKKLIISLKKQDFIHEVNQLNIAYSDNDL